MSTYQRMQGYLNEWSTTCRKRGKKLREKRRKQKLNRMHIYNDGDQDVHRFLDLDYEDSIYVPEKSVETGEDEESSV